MHEVCTRFGFCGSRNDGKWRHVTQYIPDAGPVTAEEFARWVIVAEGLDHDIEARWVKRLRSVFVKHMNADVIDASILRSNLPARSAKRTLAAPLH